MNPVIAHPERNPVVQADLRKVATLVDAGALIHRRVAARGVFVAERTVLLANRMRRISFQPAA